MPSYDQELTCGAGCALGSKQTELEVEESACRAREEDCRSLETAPVDERSGSRRWKTSDGKLLYLLLCRLAETPRVKPETFIQL